MTHNFHELKMWTRSIEFVTRIYAVTQFFPREEIYGLTSQTRRAATSISLNIAEGTGASSDVEFVRFLEMARRSAYEVITALEISFRLKYIKEKGLLEMNQEANEIAAMISGLIKSLKPK